MGTAVPASRSVPALERDGSNLMYVCYRALCADDVRSVPVQAADRSGAAFWTNHIFLEETFANIKI